MILAQLRNALGEEGVSEHEALELEGAKLEATLRPRNADALAEALRHCREAATGLLVRAGGTKLSYANAPCRARFLLDVGGIGAAMEIDSEEGVALLPACTTLVAARQALEGSCWELPLEPPPLGSSGDAATVGGTISASSFSPRFGSPRDFVLGLHVALASGERVKFGGRVVKNVTGYDLNKLFTGACGTLGVIESAWLRLRPVPEEVRVLEADLAGLGRTNLLGACRRASVRLGAVHRDGSSGRLRLELAGDAPAVDADARALAGLGLAPTGEDGATVASAPEHVRVRVTALPSAWAEAADVLVAAGARVLAQPARGLVEGAFGLSEPADERVIGALWQAARLAAERGAGRFVVEAAPVEVRVGREIFGDPGETVPLQRAIKAQYDPAGILNPGRFVGGA